MSYKTLTKDILDGKTIKVESSSVNFSFNTAYLLSGGEYVVVDMHSDYILAYPNSECSQKDITTIFSNYYNDCVMNSYYNQYKFNLPMLVAVSSTNVDEILCILIPGILYFHDRGIKFLSTSEVYQDCSLEPLLKSKTDPNDVKAWVEVFESLIVDLVIHTPEIFWKGQLRGGWVVIPKKNNRKINGHIRWFPLFGNVYPRIKFGGLRKFESERVTDEILGFVDEILEVVSDVQPTTITAKDIWSEMMKKKYHTGLSKLKDNNFVAGLVKPTAIVGPTTFNILELNGKPIFLFGDKHLPSPLVEGASLLDYLTYIFDYCPIDVDFFLETFSFYDIEYKNYQNAGEDELGRIMRVFQDCLGKNKSKCKYDAERDGVRFHNIEFRRSETSRFNFVGLGNDAIDRINRFPDRKEKFVTNLKEHSTNLFIALFDGNVKAIQSNLNTIYSFVSQKPYTQKEIKGSILLKLNKQYQNSQFKAQIKDYYIQKLELIKKFLRGTPPRQNIEAFMIMFNGYILDAYTLGRLEKSIFQYPKNLSIVYAGNSHTQNYLEVLKNIMGATVISNMAAETPHVVKLTEKSYLKTSLDKFFT